MAVFPMLGIEPRALCVVAKHSASRTTSHSYSYIIFHCNSGVRPHCTYGLLDDLESAPLASWGRPPRQAQGTENLWLLCIQSWVGEADQKPHRSETEKRGNCLHCMLSLWVPWNCHSKITMGVINSIGKDQSWLGCVRQHNLTLKRERTQD